MSVGIVASIGTLLHVTNKFYAVKNEPWVQS